MRPLSSAVVDESAFPIYRRVARWQAEQRGCWLDEYEADSAAQEIAIWLAVNAPDTISRGRRLTHHTPAYQAKFAWARVWHLCLPGWVMRGTNLDNATPAPTADADMLIDAHRAYDALEPTEQVIARLSIAGYTSREVCQVAGCHPRRVARVRAALLSVAV